MANFDARYAVGEVIRHLAGTHAGKHKTLKQIAPLIAGKTILDVGCGTGFFTAWYATLAKEVVAYDTNEYALQLAREMHPALNITYTSHSLLAQRNFDVIIFNDSLEFMQAWRDVLTAARAQAKCVIITAPSFKKKWGIDLRRPNKALTELERGMKYKSLYMRDFDLPAFCKASGFPFKEIPFALSGTAKNHRLYIVLHDNLFANCSCRCG